ncbi:putative ABC transporter ATP-binding protein/MT1014 [Oceanibacterium hippocampi]|uniref:Putative ABC transporter ATP-binding protein/MT1014 n=1 Tax=Oceanibacterium hippocampi TaxID=745714 RepID=A0A1Y5RD48_9PROT|nr:ABC transporter ATP-binding protein [Oceanibacterium hippocampi]SLN12166.1 putative ABC transporter ATP-binding protein/MT1014 [Oceanibacterium hippocampi]
MSGQSIIHLGDVHLTLMSAAGPVNILRGIDLDVGAGEAVGLVGPSGSGKSTMLAVIAGLEAASSGEVTVAGQDLVGRDEDWLARYRRDNVGIVFQAFHLVPTMTALENVAVPLELAGRRDAFDLAAEKLAQVGLGHRLSHYPSQLSGGEQQRVALARAVAGSPRILLADEPTGNLDGKTGRAIIDAMFDLHRASGGAMLLITHDPVLAAECDRCVRIEDGRIVDDGYDAGVVVEAAAGD